MSHMRYVHRDPLLIEGLATESRGWTRCVLYVCVCMCLHMNMCMYICGVYLACVYSVGAFRHSSGMRLDGPVGVGIAWD